MNCIEEKLTKQKENNQKVAQQYIESNGMQTTFDTLHKAHQFQKALPIFIFIFMKTKSESYT